MSDTDLTEWMEGKQHSVFRPEDYTVALKNAEDKLTQLITDKKVTADHLQVLLDYQKFIGMKEFTLEKNDCSRVHRLKEALIAGHVLYFTDDHKFTGAIKDTPTIAVDDANVFVVQHNWKAAFGEAIGTVDSEFNLPFDHCVFEFRINGHTLILITFSKKELKWCAFAEFGHYWFELEPSIGMPAPVGEYAWAQIRAICIALDAEVATHTVVRASSALNKKREKTGKPALSDFNVVNLARRHRISNPANSVGGEPINRKRLHFRRGHWRHFDTSKTWVKWALVGDQSLGFVDKEYRL